MGSRSCYWANLLTALPTPHTSQGPLHMLMPLLWVCCSTEAVNSQ